MREQFVDQMPGDVFEKGGVAELGVRVGHLSKSHPKQFIGSTPSCQYSSLPKNFERLYKRAG
jgi:hypothetical protein